MRYLSVCSGIEAVSIAWEPLGWTPVAFAETGKFPSALLKLRYPSIRNLGDFTKITKADVGAIDLLVGGTPCQSFSIAGLRGGLDDDRGNLALEFFRLAQRLRVRWLVWENVPGVLSQSGGRDFGTILAALAECGYGAAYRVLDAQYFGLAQRRKRVFLVGYPGDWRPAAAVLFERESLSRDPAPCAKARQDIAGTFGSRTKAGSGFGTDFDLDGGLQLARSLNAGAGQRLDSETETFVTHTLTGEGHDASEDGSGRGVPIVADADSQIAVAVSLRGRDDGLTAEMAGEQMPALRAASGGSDKAHALTARTVRRLTPLECERLQGFPDHYTRIAWRGKPPEQCPDGPRYRAIGNAMPVPVMRKIGMRIDAVQRVLRKLEIA